MAVKTICSCCRASFNIEDCISHQKKKNHSEFYLLDSLKENPMRFHTMEYALYKYLRMKVHPFLEKKKFDIIEVVGEYDRHAIISSKEKSDKRFNWKRPTAITDGKAISIKCFPGQDYVIHNVLMIYYYFKLKNWVVPTIKFDLPQEETCKDSVFNSNIKKIPESNTIILGYVDKLADNLSQSWRGKGDFQWKKTSINGITVTYVGCKFSFWGDIGGRVVESLSKKSFNIIYVGKVGGMNESHQPNRMLCTGNMSFVGNRHVSWKNVLDTDSPLIVKGLHYTSSSTLLETKDWLVRNKKYDFVDPEIGHMAKKAKENGVGFGYLHVISNNLRKCLDENLSNERNKKSVINRSELIPSIKEEIERKLRWMK